MESVEIKGLEFLNEEEKHELNKEIETYKEKLRWKTKSDFVLKFVIKEYSQKADDFIFLTDGMSRKCKHGCQNLAMFCGCHVTQLTDWQTDLGVMAHSFCA